SSNSSPCWMSAASNVLVENIQSWFVDNFLDGETQLFSGPNEVLMSLDSSQHICGGQPSLVTRSSIVKPNGACPEIFTDINASCTCLTGITTNEETWAFRIQLKRGEFSATSYPATQPVTDILEINTIQTLFVPPTLKTLSITGIGDSPLAINFVPEYRNQADDVLPIACSLKSNSSLSTIELTNIDMFTTVTSVSSFMPSSTTSVTLRNCNITSFGFTFTSGLNNLKALDLSSNNMVSAYAGTGNQLFADRCSLTLCALEEYNLSYNKLTVFPTTPLNVKTLRKFYIQGNEIKDFTVNAATFEQINKLDDFKADLARDSAQCSPGQWKTAHGARFCVVNSSSSGESSSGTNPLSFVLFAGVLVVVLLISVLVWKWFTYRNARSSEPYSRAFSQDQLYSIFTDDFKAHETIRVQLAADPIIATSRLNYDEVKLGRCISRGGFGLVFTGTYHGRSVAVKKIGVNRDVDISQIELFIREITLMALLRHQRIVEFIGVAWETLVDLSAVTELMERGDLSTVLHNYGESRYQLTWSEHKATIALHIAEALVYLHSLRPKVIHRDLKSKNVLLNEEMEAKLSDFGISRERRDVETHLTAAMGTSFWIAPEVLNGRDYDEKADVFSFGVVLSELDTEDYPYWNATNPPGGKLQEGEILQLVATGQMRPSFSSNCPAFIFEVANRCLHMRPEDRPSAAELVEIFQKLLLVE
ncbi:TKL protein kinase, partial [Phytophthora palmivora]